MKLNLSLGALLLVLLSACTNPDKEGQAPGLADESAALSQYEGQYILLEFWGSWCGPCRRELPLLIAKYPELKSQDIEVVSVALEKKEANGHALAKQLNFPWPEQLVREARYVRFDDVASDYGITDIPATVLIGPDQGVIGTYSSFETALAMIPKGQ